jgi:hypothetical protein
MGGQPTRDGPPAWELGVGLTTPHHKKIILLRIFTRGLGHGLILWIIDLSKGKWTLDLKRGMSEICIGQVRSGQSRKKYQNIS